MKMANGGQSLPTNKRNQLNPHKSKYALFFQR